MSVPSIPSIPVHLEPETWRGWCAESCCFCHQPTRFWTAIPERAAGEQVACCPFCADIFEPEVLPTKAEWFAYHAALSRRREGV